MDLSESDPLVDDDPLGDDLDLDLNCRRFLFLLFFSSALLQLHTASLISCLSASSMTSSILLATRTFDMPAFFNPLSVALLGMTSFSAFSVTAAFISLIESDSAAFVADVLFDLLSAAFSFIVLVDALFGPIST